LSFNTSAPARSLSIWEEPEGREGDAELGLCDFRKVG
jgi:hypothetical protein